MFPFWSPLSSLTLDTPPVPVTPFILRRMLARGHPLLLTYRGDRMHPAVRHAQVVEVRPAGASLPRGAVVLATPGNIPDLLRVVETRGDGTVLAADADPDSRCVVLAESILAVASLPRRRPSHWHRVARRLAMDAREALFPWSREWEDPGDSVRRKYDEQAPFYGRAAGEDREWPIEARLRGAIRPGGRILVAGSGAGSECFRLERSGFEVVGVEFASRMVAIARDLAARRGSSVRFAEGDLRSHVEPQGSLDAVVFSFDVYSFIPGRQTRVLVLSRMKQWLRPGGIICLSARRLDGLYGRALLACSLLRGAGPSGRAFGDTHTRWIGMGGAVERSFVKSFTARALAGEIRDAGLVPGPWEAGHAELRAAPGQPCLSPDPPASPTR